MAIDSFSKEMRFNKKETERLLDFLLSESKPLPKITVPLPKRATKDDLKRLFDQKK